MERYTIKISKQPRANHSELADVTKLIVHIFYSADCPISMVFKLGTAL